MCVVNSAVTGWQTLNPRVRQASLQIQVFRVWHIHSFNNKLSSSNRKDEQLICAEVSHITVILIITYCYSIAIKKTTHPRHACFCLHSSLRFAQINFLLFFCIKLFIQMIKFALARFVPAHMLGTSLRFRGTEKTASFFLTFIFS